MTADRTKYRKAFSQIPVFLGKFFRMFIYQNDWKMLPMAALIAMIVSFVIRPGMMKTMEGTLKGSLALSCIAIWNGFFNSIQVICRERGIVKREHRGGMRIFSYVTAHMIYQAALCLAEAVISVTVFGLSGIRFPGSGIVSGSFVIDFTITFFLITYASDSLALLISSAARSTTSAMTVMPFVLIFELLFSGAVFTLEGSFSRILSLFTIAKWGMTAMCAIGQYNSLGMVSVWNMLLKFENVEFGGFYPLKDVIEAIRSQEGGIEAFERRTGELSSSRQYASEADNVVLCWVVLIIFAFAAALLAMLSLSRIDRDRR